MTYFVYFDCIAQSSSALCWVSGLCHVTMEGHVTRGDGCRSSESTKNSKPPKSNITSKERTALNSLNKDKDIVILKADKGRTTVVLNRSDYEQKMKKTLVC